jgi:NAD(P)-dependent dehydrogenase (short-subunit alcohol dehydrogenase family)
MLPGGFKLIFISSISAATASVSRGEYCVSKAGIAMASQLWAARLADSGAQVYEVRPGIMATDMTSAVKEKYDALIAEGLVPQRRWGTPEDVGAAVKSLALGDFAFSTGEVIYSDGGFHISRL